MAVNSERIYQPTLHPLHGVLLAATIPLYLGALLSDLAYAASYQIQWSNFSSWLITGGLVFGGFALLWAITSLMFARRRPPHSGLYVFLLAITWVLSLVNSFTHAKDAWAMMPTGPILSGIVVLLAGVSTWVGFAKFGVGGQR